MYYINTENNQLNLSMKKFVECKIFRSCTEECFKPEYQYEFKQNSFCVGNWIYIHSTPKLNSSGQKSVLTVTLCTKQCVGYHWGLLQRRNSAHFPWFQHWWHPAVGSEYLLLFASEASRLPHLQIPPLALLTPYWTHRHWLIIKLILFR